MTGALACFPLIMRCMAFDQDLADRIRELVAHEDNVVEQRMFGGFPGGWLGTNVMLPSGDALGV